ncbi:MAG: hypothetical protein GEU71_14720 [Actinobacteria bacterium]|nr:hypothetical protein [Actinomycetota bacterium]
MIKKVTTMLAAAAAVALLLGACGSDDIEARASSETKSAAGSAAMETDLQAFCDAAVGSKSALIAASEGNPTEDPAPLMDAAEANAPEEIIEELDVLLTTARSAVESRDTRALESEEFRTVDQAVDRYIADNCESQKLSVTGIDYAFDGMPTTVSAGRATIDFANGGEELHEMLLMRIEEPGFSVDDLLHMPQKQAQKKLSFVRALFAPPGESDVETFDLEPGEYAVVCFVPVGATSVEAAESAGGPPHAMKGMAAQLTVE